MRRLKAVFRKQEFILPTDCEFKVICNVAEPRDKWIDMAFYEDGYKVCMMVPEVDFRAILDKMQDIASDMDRIYRVRIINLLNPYLY